jgi:16S rRNA (cytosine1402-N4)-methyltransferase
MIATYSHIPVMAERALELLGPALQGSSPLLVDATLGLGGHTEMFLASVPALRVLGIDRDPEALEQAAARLAPYGDRVLFAQCRYDELGRALEENAGGAAPEAILFDLGVSSLHVDKPERGFSYSHDAPLDMRMNPQDDISAADILQSFTEADLSDLFFRLGDEKLAKRYARAIVERRLQAPIVRTGDLVEVLQEATPYALKDKGHPAKRVFQALRMAVNSELESLARALPIAFSRVAVGGRVAVMSYHSGEDRLVKRELRKLSVSTAPAGLPTELPQHRPSFREITRGAEMASAQEISENPRSASVRLRAGEKVKEVSP